MMSIFDASAPYAAEGFAGFRPAPTTARCRQRVDPEHRKLLTLTTSVPDSAATTNTAPPNPNTHRTFSLSSLWQASPVEFSVAALPVALNRRAANDGLIPSKP